MNTDAAAADTPNYPSRRSHRNGHLMESLDHPKNNFLSKKKSKTILIRWLAIIATSYLLLLNRGSYIGMPIAVLLSFYIGSNLIIMSLPVRFFFHKGFDFLIVLLDTLLVSLAIYLSGTQQTDLYLAYFLILVVSAVGRNLKMVIVGAVIVSAFYGWTVFNGESGDLFHQAGLLFRIPFLFLIAAFYGFFVEENSLLHHRSRMTAKELEVANRELQNMSWSTLQTLLNALDIRDINTAGHSNRVRRYTAILAKAMGLQGKDLVATEQAALLHDIGKIGIPDSILMKAGPLTPAEWKIMKQHPTLGYQMLKDSKFLADTASIVLHHHERYDGNGYPSGLKGRQIPLEARIFAVIDAFDAITTERPYKKGLPYEAAVKDLKKNAGKQFDPEVVEVFLKIPPSVWVSLRHQARSGDA